MSIQWKTGETESPRTREETLVYLEYESVRWVNLRDRADRSAGLDGRLNLDRDNVMERINSLLEDLLTQSGVIHET